MRDLSILIPARNEQFLARTIEDILVNIEADTEIVAVLDGAWADPPIPSNPRVRLIHYPVSIGQRAATNAAARTSTAKFLMKADAHCAFDKGFDAKLMANCEYDMTVTPRLYNLHVFDWECELCGTRFYQGPQPHQIDRERTEAGTKAALEKHDKDCGRQQWKQTMVWQPRWSRKSDHYRFDETLHFQYWGALGLRPESIAQGDISDTMSLLGACWLLHRERYWELEGSDEAHGSWGQQGTEVACKTWLSGGRLVTNKATWYSHLFRTQAGFGFPYRNPGIDKAREYSRWLWRGNRWPKAIHPMSWLIEKFAPVPDWTDEEIDKLRKEERGGGAAVAVSVPEAAAPVGSAAIIRPAVSAPVQPIRQELTKGIVYYTENRCPEPVFSAVQQQLLRVTKGMPIISVSLKPIKFGSKNIVLDRERGILTMFKEILAGLEAAEADIIFFAEHDVLYNETHYHFNPPRDDVFYYNQNAWRLDAATGQALFWYCKQTAQLCAYRTTLVEHYRRRVAKIEQNARDLIAQGHPVKNDGYSRFMGYEPGCHRPPRGVDNFTAEGWFSPVPNIDVRHSANLTPSRWDQKQFRNQNTCLGWYKCDGIPGWSKTKDRMSEFWADLSAGVIPEGESK